MLRSQEGQNPAMFTADLFNSTPVPRYKQVSCTSVVLPSNISLLNNECVYVIFVTLRSLNDDVTRGNKIIYVPNDVSLNASVASLIDFMYYEVDETTLQNVIEQTSIVHSVEHLELFLNIVEFFRHLNYDLYESYFPRLKQIVNGDKKFNKERVNIITNEIKLYILNRTDWFTNYERHVNFRLSDYIKVSYNQTTRSFSFRFVGNESVDVGFKILPFEANINDETVYYNKLFMWLGSDRERWNCSQIKKEHRMPRIANIRERFGFIKIYISFVERRVVLGSDHDYNHLMAIISLNTKSNYYNLTENFLNISPYTDLLKCECIIKTAFDEIVQFSKSKQGTTIIFKFK